MKGYRKEGEGEREGKAGGGEEGRGEMEGRDGSKLSLTKRHGVPYHCRQELPTKVLKNCKIFFFKTEDQMFKTKTKS